VDRTAVARIEKARVMEDGVVQTPDVRLANDEQP
jgi:hypothetical protein